MSDIVRYVLRLELVETWEDGEETMMHRASVISADPEDAVARYQDLVRMMRLA